MSLSAKNTLRVLGFMTGTSMDAVDMAVIETDGQDIVSLGPAGEMKLNTDDRQVLQQAIADALLWPRGQSEPTSFGTARTAIADLHLKAGRQFLEDQGLTAADLDLVGVHGQTVLHEAPTDQRLGRTVQLIDAGRVAQGLGLPVVHDFRSADVAAGGQGAPLAPVYHSALVRWSGLTGPVAVLNLGGVGNITLVHQDGRLEAFDTGPANGMVDQWVQRQTGASMDHDGVLARAGVINQEVLDTYLNHSYFGVSGPKSLDRYDFSLDPVRGLSLSDAVATLTAFAAQAVALAVARFHHQPESIVVCGGGRHNPSLLDALRQRIDVPIVTAEDMSWRGDSIEAEAFAYLAARRVRNLPISFPGTTGIDRPLTGGSLALVGTERT